MDEKELAEIEEWANRLWPIHSLMPWFKKLLAEVRRLKAENRAMQSRLDIAEGRVGGMREEIENLAGELRDEKAYAKELRDNMGQAGIY